MKTTPSPAPRKLSAKPDGGLTHNATVYEADGTNTEVAKLTYRMFHSGGTITLSDNSASYKVVHKTNSGIWSLIPETQLQEVAPLIVARKEKWWRNSVEFEADGVVYEMLRPTSTRRDYLVSRVDAPQVPEQGVEKDGKENSKVRGTQVGDVTADSSFKRSYTLTFDANVRIEIVLLCYWLVSLFNKRSNAVHQANANAGAANAAAH